MWNYQASFGNVTAWINQNMNILKLYYYRSRNLPVKIPPFGRVIFNLYARVLYQNLSDLNRGKMVQRDWPIDLTPEMRFNTPKDSGFVNNLPCVVFDLLWRIPHLGSEIQFIDDMVDSHVHVGEQGHMFTTLKVTILGNFIVTALLDT